MKKKLLIIAASSFIFVIAILIIMLNAVKQAETPKPKPIGPLPSISQTLPTFQLPVDLKVTSVSPQNGASDIALDSSAVINFNRRVKKGEVVVEFIDGDLKNIEYDLKLDGAKAVLKPKNGLKQSTIYTVRVRDRYLSIISEFQFLTLTLVPSPDTRPEPAVLTGVVTRTRQERPDVYLANLMPHHSYDFSMELEIDEEGYFTFVATSNRFSGELLKDAVNRWLQSLDLTTEQIKDLPIEYR